VKIDRFRVKPGDRRALERHASDVKGRFSGKEDALAYLQKGIARLEARQALFYARDQYSLLLIFQGMDGAGKDSAIKHVLSGINPLGTDVRTFKQPSSEELAHDFLWRAAKALPARGRIGVFDRSYYEDVLVVRVHPELVAARHLPAERVTPRIWNERFESINAFERHLWRNGTIIRKFFLQISRDEQRRRLMKRLEDPAKNWKFSAADLPERANWKAYMRAYERMIAATSSREAPWYVIPADHKWFAHAAIADVVLEALDELDLAPPRLSKDRRRDLREAQRVLAAEAAKHRA
jgi:PPK2 family polyphosphate:nucleotide phosphotransferase